MGQASHPAFPFITRVYPLTHGNLLLRKQPRISDFDRGPPVTVCIAARAGGIIFGASDRMLTSGDVQFEPSAGMKIYSLTTSIFMMTAGDAALQAQITEEVEREVAVRIEKEPHSWWLVSDVANLYIKQFNIVRNKRAGDAILSPLFLDGASFVANQKSLSDQLVNDISKELLHFPMPRISAIFAGVDPTGSHIYMVRENDANALESNCVDNVGFVAIGIGGRHASSEFMFARHAWNSPLPDTLFLTYYAKKKAEVAPGVGKGTDMVMVGPGLGSLTQVGDHVKDRLEAEYKRVARSESGAFARARREMAKYVEELGRQAQAGTAADQQTPPKSDGGTASPNGGSGVREPPEAATPGALHKGQG